MNLYLDDKLASSRPRPAAAAKEIATALAREGATVIVNGRTVANVDAAVADIAPACRARSLQKWTPTTAHIGAPVVRLAVIRRAP